MNKIGYLLIVVIVATVLLGCSPPEDRLVLAAARDDLPSFRKLSARGISIDAQERQGLGDTPLTVAAVNNGTNVFFYLLSKGAKVDARNRQGDTPLMLAVMRGDGNLPKIKALINAGADVNSQNRGVSVMQLAKWAATNHAVSGTIELLTSHGATQ